MLKTAIFAIAPLRIASPLMLPDKPPRRSYFSSNPFCCHTLFPALTRNRYTPEGCRVHFYNGRFGSDYGGQGWKPDVYVKKPWKMGRVICVSPNGIMKADKHYYGEGSKWVKTWSEAIKLMEDTHGSRAKVALYPTASMQISEANASSD